MAKELTLEDLKGMTVHERAALYRNACRLGHTTIGAALKLLIEEAGLPYSEDSALKRDDHITLKMIEVIYSSTGRQAAIAATNAGEAAMEGIDPLLQVALGSDYGPHNMATNRAGEITGALMRSLGYIKSVQKDLPRHCIAKTAASWKRRK